MAATATGDWDWILATGARSSAKARAASTPRRASPRWSSSRPIAGSRSALRPRGVGAPVRGQRRRPGWRPAPDVARGRGPRPRRPGRGGRRGGRSGERAVLRDRRSGLRRPCGDLAGRRGPAPRGCRPVRPDRPARTVNDAELETFRAAVSALEAAPNAGDQFERRRGMAGARSSAGSWVCLMALGGLLGATDERAAVPRRTRGRSSLASGPRRSGNGSTRPSHRLRWRGRASRGGSGDPGRARAEGTIPGLTASEPVSPVALRAGPPGSHRACAASQPSSGGTSPASLKSGRAAFFMVP